MFDHLMKAGINVSLRIWLVLVRVLQLNWPYKVCILYAYTFLFFLFFLLFAPSVSNWICSIIWVNFCNSLNQLTINWMFWTRWLRSLKNFRFKWVLIETACVKFSRSCFVSPHRHNVQIRNGQFGIHIEKTRVT